MIDGNDSGKIELYVSRWGGNDSNDGLSENACLRTIQAAINKLPKFNLGKRAIKVAPGAYEENVEIDNFMGGEIRIVAADKNNKPTINRVTFRDCDKAVLSRVIMSDKDTEGVYFDTCKSVEVKESILNSTHFGLLLSDCPFVNISSNEFNNASSAAIQANGSIVYANSNNMKNKGIGIQLSSALVFNNNNNISSATKYELRHAQVIE